MPPNSCFTMIIANTLPTTAIHHVAVGGRINPRIKPVTAADRSPTRTGSRPSFCHRYSATTADAVDTHNSISARVPKYHTPAAADGRSASSTLSISRVVVLGERIWGAVERRRLISQFPLSPAARASV